MNTDTAKKILKVLGILTIIFAVFELLSGIGMVGCGSLLGSATSVEGVTVDDAAAVAATSGLIMVYGILVLVEGIIELLLGIFSVRASNDFSKIGPAYTLSIVGLILSVIGLIMTFVNGGFTASDIIGGLVGIAFSGVLFYAAKTIKDAA